MKIYFTALLVVLTCKQNHKLYRVEKATCFDECNDFSMIDRTLQRLSVGTEDQTQYPVSRVWCSTTELLPPQTSRGCENCHHYDLADENEPNRSQWVGDYLFLTIDLSSLAPGMLENPRRTTFSRLSQHPFHLHVASAVYHPRTSEA